MKLVTGGELLMRPTDLDTFDHRSADGDSVAFYCWPELRVMTPAETLGLVPGAAFLPAPAPRCA